MYTSKSQNFSLKYSEKSTGCQLAPKCNSSQGQLPHIFLHILYGYGNSAMLLYPRVMALLEEHQLEDNASLSSHSDDNASSSSFLSLMQTWTNRMCDQPLVGALHVSNIGFSQVGPNKVEACQSFLFTESSLVLEMNNTWLVFLFTTLIEGVAKVWTRFVQG